MVATDFDAEREYDDERLSAQSVFRSDRTKVVLGYFEPGQFIAVTARKPTPSGVGGSA